MNQQESIPALEQQRALYDAAVRFRDLAPWKWMWDSDLFGVQDPETGEVGYCAVMGRLGEHFALGVYLGSEGLNGYLAIQAEQSPLDSWDTLMLQRAVIASFVDRRYLRDGDLKVIRQLGLKFRGRSAWPQLRSHRPGYEPWYLRGGEVRFLTLALEQAMEVAARYRDDPAMLIPPREGQYLVRVCKPGEAGLQWRDSWQVPALLPPTAWTPPPIDEARLLKMRQTLPQTDGILEADLFYAPSAVKEEKDERPYLPRTALMVDHRSGHVFTCDLFAPGEAESGFVASLLELLERQGMLPREVWVSREETFHLAGFGYPTPGDSASTRAPVEFAGRG